MAELANTCALDRLCYSPYSWCCIECNRKDNEDAGFVVAMLLIFTFVFCTAFTCVAVGVGGDALCGRTVFLDQRQEIGSGSTTRATEGGKVPRKTSHQQAVRVHKTPNSICINNISELEEEPFIIAHVISE